jgi:hypothetical protein
MMLKVVLGPTTYSPRLFSATESCAPWAVNVSVSRPSVTTLVSSMRQLAQVGLGPMVTDL